MRGTHTTGSEMRKISRGQGFNSGFYFILFLGVTGVFLLLPNCAYASKASDIQRELATTKAAHAELLKKSSALNSEVSTLKGNLVSVSKDLRASEESLSATDQNLKELQQKKEIYLQNLYKDQKAMGGLVSAIKKYSQASTPDLLVQSKPIDAARASLVMKSLMPRLQQQSAFLKMQLAEIKKIEADIAGQLQVQTLQNQKLSKQQDGLASLLKERKQIYQSTENERRAQEKEVARLTKESNNIEELMTKIKSKNYLDGDRKIAARLPAGMSPVHGKIHTGFGQKDDLGAPSKGITFSTRPGASVVTPLAGIVKFAGAFQKYKQILIVEHRGGYHSLIAGLARIDTVVGASLAASEPVGVAETSGSPQIYYELRQDGKPINPQKSLVAQRKQEKG